MTSAEAISLGAKIAEDHKSNVIALVRERDMTIEQALDAHIVWLAAHIMKAMAAAERAPRGFFVQLTPEQQEHALAYRGEDC